jgi:hypothetical protein
MQVTANEAADIITGTYGKLTITYRRLTYTWTVTVYNGTLRIEELCDTFDTAHAAWTEAQRIALAAHQGKTVWQIEAEKPSELTLADAKRIIDGIAANMDEVAARRDTTALTWDCQAIAAGAPNWNAFRQQVRRDFSKGRVHRRPLTAAELDLIRHARTDADGNLVVTTRPGQTWLVLKAMQRRIGGVPTYRGTTRIITALTYRHERLSAYLTSEGNVAA